MPRLKQRLRNWRRGTNGFREERPNLFVQSPLVLPFPYFNLARRINRWMLKRSITRWMTAVGAARPVVWTFLPTPLARDVIASLDPALTIYYCIDDLASSSPEARTDRAERAAAVQVRRSRLHDLGKVAGEGGAVQRSRPLVSVRRQHGHVREGARRGGAGAR